MSTARQPICSVAGITALLLIGIGVGATGCRDKPVAVPWRSGTTVIPGNAGWDVETDSLDLHLRAPTTDFWWEQISPTQRYLTPVNETQAAVVRSRSFEEIGPKFLSHWRLPNEKISGSDENGVLDPGAVVVFRTADGTLGKLQVVGYRCLHDFSFPAVSDLGEERRRNALEREDVARYHIEVKWQLYRLPSR